MEPVVSGWGGHLWVPGLPETHDPVQARHAITRNFPVVGHSRFLIEALHREIRQYLIESGHEEVPFSRDRRTIVYQRAKDMEDSRRFGGKSHRYEPGFAWVNHSFQSLHRHIEDFEFRGRIGDPARRRPYDASIHDISAMSFGALSANGIRALNTGARTGGFARGIARMWNEVAGVAVPHLTGERAVLEFPSISRHDPFSGIVNTVASRFQRARHFRVLNPADIASQVVRGQPFCGLRCRIGPRRQKRPHDPHAP